MILLELTLEEAEALDLTVSNGVSEFGGEDDPALKSGRAKLEAAIKAEEDRLGIKYERVP
jgi:hypothetical protein